ncbi:MAG: hypothetical protein GX220_01510 [Treponema sp.]|nr:hypothetical protein [Treponema sp.]
MKRLEDLDFSYLSPSTQNKMCTVVTDVEASKKEYIEKVIALKKHIVSGDIIQAVSKRNYLVRMFMLLLPVPFL